MATAGINLGDAVLSVLVDLSSANATLDQFAASLPARLKPSADAASAVATGFDKVATATTAAGAAATESVSNLQAMANSLKADGLAAQDVASALVNLGFQSKDAAVAAGVLKTAVEDVVVPLEKIPKSTPAAVDGLVSLGTRGTAGVVGLRQQLMTVDEALGVRLPRGVTGLLATLPGLGSVLSVVFDASVVFFLVEAVIKADAALQALADHQKLSLEAWRSYGDVSAEANRQVALGLAEADAALKGVDLSLKLTADQMKNFGKDVQDSTRFVKEMGDALVKALTASAVSKFNPLSWWNDNSRKDAKDAEEFFQRLTSDVQRFGAEAGTVTIDAHLKTLNATMDQVIATEQKESTTWGKEYFADRAAGLQKEISALNDIRGVLATVITERQKDDAASRSDVAQQQLQKLSAEAQRDLDTDLARIKLRESSEHLAFAAGEKDAADWAVAQRNATDAALAAHERFAQRIVDLSNQFGDADQKREAAQKLATDRTLDEAKQTDTLAAATEKYHDSTLKILKDWEQLEVNSVTKSFEQAQKAAEKLTLAELALGVAQENVAKAQQTSNLNAQKSAIEQLAALGVITEEEKANRLQQLYAREEADALASLQKLLNLEQQAVSQGSARLAEAQASGDDAKILEAQAYQDKLITDYDRTYAKLISTQSSYDDKSMALQTQMLKSASASWDGFFKALLAGSLRSGQAIQIMGNLIAQGIGQSVTAAVGGSQSFGQALEGLVKATLASLAGIAVTHVIEEVAKAASDFATAATMAADPFTAALAPGFIASAHAHLAAAAEWGAIGGGAAIGGAAIPNSTSSSSGASASHPTTTATAPNPAQTPTQQPISVVNTPHLAGGGLFSRQMLAVVGDTREAVVPLGNNSAAIEEIAGRLHDKMGQSGMSVVNNHHWDIKGLISGNDLQKVAKKITQQVNKGTARLGSSNTRRLTRRG